MGAHSSDLLTAVLILQRAVRAMAALNIFYERLKSVARCASPGTTVRALISGEREEDAVRGVDRTASEEFNGQFNSEKNGFVSGCDLRGSRPENSSDYGVGPQPPTRELAEVSAPTPMATGCDTMPL